MSTDIRAYGIAASVNITIVIVRTAPFYELASVLLLLCVYIMQIDLPHTQINLVQNQESQLNDKANIQLAIIWMELWLCILWLFININVCMECAQSTERIFGLTLSHAEID